MLRWIFRFNYGSGGSSVSDFNWWHGPECHTKHTVDRIRGVKGSKVLRTRKIKAWGQTTMYSYFCSNNCYDNFANKYIEQVIAIAPRTECLETPILNPERQDDYWKSIKITVDETRQS